MKLASTPKMNAVISYVSILVVACSMGKGLGVSDFTDPAPGSLILGFEGAVNATTITCNVTNSQGIQISTQWSLGNFRASDRLQTINTAAPELFEIDGDPQPGAAFTFENQLTVLNFVSDLDRVIVYCGTGARPQEANFTLRIYQPPNLRDNFLVRIEERSENVPVDLRQEPAAFPEPTLFSWTKDGQPLTGLPLTYSSVTFGTVRRTDAGKYTVSATNFVIGSSTEQVGNDTGSFCLDVIYGPSFQSDGPQQMPTQAYVLLGSPLSLVCGRGLDSNPEATITWLDTNNLPIMDNARYDLENGTDIVRLNFTRTIPSDNGMWTCDVIVRSERYVVNNDGDLTPGAVAVIGTPIQHVFMVTVIAPPGPPRTLSVETVGATWIQICWQSPIDVNFPISRYEIIARATDNFNTIIRNMSTPDNTTFVNVTRLLPGTTYNFTVVAVIEAGAVIARSVESEPLGDIMTGVTVPEIVCPRPVSQDGDITVMWSYVHTGGLPLTGVSVMYSYVEGTSTNTEAVSSVGISDLMVTVPDLVAGEQYTFTVTAENSNGSSSTVCEPVDHIIGVPATPQFGDLTIGPGSGQITIPIKTVASGVNNPVHGFQFRLTPVLVGVEQMERSFAFPEYTSGQFVTITVDQLQPGMSYSFSATAMNTFGTSESISSPPQFSGGPAPPPQTGSSTNVGAIAGGVVAAIVIVSLTAIIIVVILYLIVLRGKGNHGNYKVEGGKYHKASTSDPGVKVEEAPAGIDIGADLEKHPPKDDTEIQYAELETFRPPSREKNGANEPSPQQPEEPVEYAVITTFKKKEDKVATESSAVPDPTPAPDNDADKAGTSTTLV